MPGSQPPQSISLTPKCQAIREALFEAAKRVGVQLEISLMENWESFRISGDPGRTMRVYIDLECGIRLNRAKSPNSSQTSRLPPDLPTPLPSPDKPEARKFDTGVRSPNFDRVIYIPIPCIVGDPLWWKWVQIFEAVLRAAPPGII